LNVCRETDVHVQLTLICVEGVYSDVFCSSFTTVLMSDQSILKGAKIIIGKGFAPHPVLT
jgi:hypothetical protein